MSMMPAHPSTTILSAMLASLDGRRVTGCERIAAHIMGVEVGGNLEQLDDVARLADLLR